MTRLVPVLTCIALLFPSLAAPQAPEIATTVAFTEGPVADRDGNVYFTELVFQRIMKLTPQGVLSVFREASNNANWRKHTDALAKSFEIAISVTRLNESLRRDFAIAVDDEHSAVRDAIAAGDPERARAAAALHMQKSAERVLSADQEFWIKDGSRIIDLPRAT